jgi:hypothetical protein
MCKPKADKHQQSACPLWEMDAALADIDGVLDQVYPIMFVFNDSHSKVGSVHPSVKNSQLFSSHSVIRCCLAYVKPQFSPNNILIRSHIGRICQL